MALLALAPMRRPKLLMHGGASRRALEGSLCRYPSAPLLVHVDVVRSQTRLALCGHYRKHASAERERGGGTTCISLVAGRQGRVWPRRSTSQSNASFVRDMFNVVGTPGRTRMAEGEHLVVHARAFLQALFSTASSIRALTIALGACAAHHAAPLSSSA